MITAAPYLLAIGILTVLVVALLGRTPHDDTPGICDICADADRLKDRRRAGHYTNPTGATP